MTKNKWLYLEKFWEDYNKDYSKSVLIGDSTANELLNHLLQEIASLKAQVEQLQEFTNMEG